MNTKTKLTALFVSLLMLVAMLPTFAISAAADATDGAAEFAEGHVVVATIEDADKYYTSFEAAWAAAIEKDDSTIKLLANTFVTSNPNHETRAILANTGWKTTVDLNGYVLTPVASGTNAHFMLEGANTVLVIKDSNTENLSHWYSVNTETGLWTWVEAADTDEAARTGLRELVGGAMTGGLTTTSGEGYGGGAITVRSKATVEIYGGNFVGNQGTRGGAVMSDGKYNSVNYGSVKIFDGMFVGNLATEQWSLGAANLRAKQFDTLYLAGGTFVGGAHKTSGVVIDIGELEDYIPVGYKVATVTGYNNAFSIEAPKPEAVVVDGVTHHMVTTGTPVASTCTQEGSSGARSCIDEHTAGVACTYTDAGVPVPKMPHNEVADAPVAPTCTTPGLSDGSHCSLCNNPIFPQEEIPAFGHDAVWTQTKAPTETEVGHEVKKCTVCDEVIEERDIPVLEPQTEPATTAPETTPATNPATTTTPADDTGCKSVVGSAVGMILVALLGSCMVLRKKED